MSNNKKRYRKLNDIEHCLKRPGMYIGSIKPHTSEKYYFDGSKMLKKEFTYNPGFLKLFDEIIMNSVDENKRKGSKLNTIKVEIDKDIISIWDNGGIPVEKDEEWNEWIPEMIFSNLKSGSNFDDTESRTGAGTNGVGSTLTNIYSSEFEINTCDGKNQFSQSFSNNMGKRSRVKITKSKTNHTKITYKPDYKRFGMDGLDSDHFELIYKRVVDIAGCNPQIKVFFNKKEIKVKSFEDYIKFYKDNVFYQTLRDKSWSLGISNSSDGFQQVSFVNSTDTYDGGSHVDYILNQIISKLREYFKRKHKYDLKPSEIKNHLFLFVNSTVINPAFSSQTKEKMITEVKEFGYEFEVTDKLITQILKSEIVESILDWISQKKIADENKLARQLNKKASKIKVDKLIDAKGKERWKCSLGIFEGDCLHEDTEVRVIREGNIMDVKIKDATTEDLVITHNNSISNIYSITKKIKHKSIIKTKNGNLINSKYHKWFVYDSENNEFYFEKTINLDKSKHKLVKNYLAFTDSLLIIKESNGFFIELESGDLINTNPEHKFAIYDRIENKFKMCKSIDVIPDVHLLVNTFGFG